MWFCVIDCNCVQHASPHTAVFGVICQFFVFILLCAYRVHNNSKSLDHGHYLYLAVHLNFEHF